MKLYRLKLVFLNHRKHKFSLYTKKKRKNGAIVIYLPVS
ncbi:hypothetical protein NC99_06010 [Sunxiuqinia dokdonensis]|uniref:Uncharacterized protein n=1 Tax=Sunxiuqinia dokdonensis TaxID=1409788 RepID=A0A0L8VDT8_9BACT|nr:hypothetical protein NC99_06010 [Sunxiuqinia dokdonensis]